MRLSMTTWPRTRTTARTLLVLASGIACAACGLDQSGLAPFDAAGLALRDGSAGTGGGAGGSAGSGGAGSDGGGGDTTGDARALDAAGGADGGADAPGDAVADAPVISPIGCADGTREGFLNVGGYPLIAACGGGWEVPGLLTPSALAPQCARQGGNTGLHPAGAGCSVADLCAEGWHVCRTAVEVFQLAGDCKDAVGPAGAGHTFFVTRQRALGITCPAANDVGTNRLHGCGNFGGVDDRTCTPFMMMLRDTDCAANTPWLCPITTSGTVTHAEYETVTKLGPAHGGALCCHD